MRWPLSGEVVKKFLAGLGTGHCMYSLWHERKKSRSAPHLLRRDRKGVRCYVDPLERKAARELNDARRIGCRRLAEQRAGNRRRDGGELRVIERVKEIGTDGQRGSVHGSRWSCES